MSNPIEFAAVCLIGFITILCTRPVVSKFSSSWRWTWGFIVLAIYEVTHWLANRFWSDYQGEHAYLIFFWGAVAGSTSLWVMDKLKTKKTGKATAH